MSVIESNKNLIHNRYDPKDRIGWEDQRESLQGMDDLTKPIRLGGSDVGTIMGLNEYKARGALYYEFLGLKERHPVINPHVYRGHALEQVIIDEYWSYFDPVDGSIEQLMEQARTMTPLRTARNHHAMVVNKGMDGLFANVDSLIDPDDHILEIKSMYSSALDKWEAGIPPNYVVQLQTYLMISEVDYGEVFVLADATMPVMFPFNASKDLQASILEFVDDFKTRVEAARAGIAKTTDPSEAWAIAAEFEPPPEETPAYIKFLKEIHRPENAKDPLEGDEETLGHVVAYSKIKQQINELTDALVPHEVFIRDKFNKGEYNKIEFEQGNVTWGKRFSLPYKKFI